MGMWLWLVSSLLWADDRVRVADQTYAEIWMVSEGVNRADASVLAGDSKAGQQAVRWQELSGRMLVDPSTTRENRTSESVCADLAGRDPVPGRREVAVYYTRGPDRPRDPEVILVSGAEGEQALVSLQPGEQVTSVHREDPETGEQAEFLEVRSRTGRLTLMREGQGSTSCYAMTK